MFYIARRRDGEMQIEKSSRLLRSTKWHSAQHVRDDILFFVVGNSGKIKIVVCQDAAMTIVETLDKTGKKVEV